jgi:hypothetical protein
VRVVVVAVDVAAVFDFTFETMDGEGKRKLKRCPVK